MKCWIFLLSLFISSILFAQKASEADDLFNIKQYYKAIEAYEKLLKKKPKDALFNYRLGRSYYEVKETKKAIIHLELAGDRYALRNLYLGELYLLDYQFEESISAYQAYLSTLNAKDEKITEIQREIQRAELGIRLLHKVEDISIIDSTVVSKKDFLSAYKISSELGTIKSNAIKLKPKKVADKITFNTQRNDRMYFSDSIKGQMDIFTSYKLMDEWSKPLLLSETINSSANENYPFLSLDGVTLYFASDAENSLGGYDIFITRFNPSDSGFLPPENIGMPFNSPANDYMLVVDEIHKLGWFATDRNQPEGKVVIYTFVPNELKTIIRSDDKVSILQAAKLEKYRKVDRTVMSRLVPKKDKEINPISQLHFVLNDSIVYNRIEDFTTASAAKQWEDIELMKEKIQSESIRLEGLREGYHLASVEERESLSTDILLLENEINSFKQTLYSQIQTLRYEENKNISNLLNQPFN